MERILVIGCPGSGKTRLAKLLGEKLNIPVVHLDNLWWTGCWENVSREEFDARLEEALEEEAWIIDGNFSRTMEHRLRYCAPVFFLDLPPLVCLWGVIRRMITDYGRTREDMGGNCPERFDPEFVKFIWNFNRNNRNMNYTWIAQAKHARAVILKNRREAKAFLDSIR